MTRLPLLLLAAAEPEAASDLADMLHELEARLVPAAPDHGLPELLAEQEFAAVVLDLDARAASGGSAAPQPLHAGGRGPEPDTAQDGGFALLRELRRRFPHLPVVALSGSQESRIAIEAVKAGAFDFLSKPVAPSDLRRAAEEALACARKSREPVTIAADADLDDSSDSLVGRSRAMLDVYKQLGRLSPTPVTVLIRGETGTGKELIARALYQYGHRAHRAFVTVNCAAIPENLLESELFGHEKGAFTGAVSTRIGKFEQANGATLFLDEIGDLDHSLQAKLLRVLQEKRFHRVGGSEEISVDVRVIAATHRSLERMIAEGRFREDLFYRLNVATIKLPPLRDRTGDIPLLTRFFLKRFSAELALPAVPISRAALARLESSPLPGNVRQLQNIVRKALLRCRGYEIDRELVEELVAETEPAPPFGQGEESLRQLCSRLFDEAPGEGRGEVHGQLVEAAESLLLEIASGRCGGNISEIARRLGLSRLTVRERLKKYGLIQGVHEEA